MLELLFQYVAMALDTLPVGGRIALLAFLLALTLCAFSNRLQTELGSRLNVMYRKGALVSMLVVPLAVFVLGVQMPVYVDEFARFQTVVPYYLTVGFSVVWMVGAFVRLRRVWMAVTATHRALEQDGLSDPSEKLRARVAHWCRRLNQSDAIAVHVGGGERAWHASASSAHVVLPAAAVNWPMGVVDVLLLQQLAQIRQRAWSWSLFGALVAAVYWPIPWVKRMADQLSEHMAAGGASLARSAYRDREGWRRDVRSLAQRSDTLGAHDTPGVDGLFRLPSVEWIEPEQARQRRGEVDDSFEDKWALTKHRRSERHRDPYEQAYWLIAVACLLVGVATTLTVVKTPPEFEPQFLEVKWQDQMGRRIRETDSAGKPSE